MRRNAPGLAAATVCVTLGWRLIEIGSEVQLATDLDPARRPPQVEPPLEVLHLHPEVQDLGSELLRPMGALDDHVFRGS